MKLSQTQKKNCNGCRGLDGEGCTFGVSKKLKSISRKNIMMPSEYIPAEPCYKPLTYKDYFIVRDEIDKERA